MPLRLLPQSHRTALLVALSLAGPVLPAGAADLKDAPEIVLEPEPARFYLRGDLGYDFRSGLDIGQVVSAPGLVLSAGTADARIEDGVSGGLGLGWQAADWLRADATARIFSADIEGAAPALCLSPALCAAPAAGGGVEAVELMANLYGELGTIAGFTPYLGGGLGAVHLSYDDTALLPVASAAAPLSVGGEDSWRFAWALAGGVAYDVTERVVLDLGYRYLDVEGGDAFRVAPAIAPGTTLSGEDDGFRRHSIQVGFRYRFG